MTSLGFGKNINPLVLVELYSQIYFASFRQGASREEISQNIENAEI